MDSAILATLEDIHDGKWHNLETKLHRYLHWRTADGRALRGRSNVLAELEKRPSTGEPSSYELRDGQIYRWTTESRVPHGGPAVGAPASASKQQPGRGL